MVEPKRFSVSFPPKTAALLEQLAASMHMSQQEVIRKAIWDDAQLQKEQRAGSKIIVESADGSRREAVFL